MSDAGNNWPNGLSEEVAVIGASINCIEDRLNVSFNEDFDDLDGYRYYIFKFEKGYCALMRYNNAQINGVTLIVEEKHLQKLDDFLSYFLQELHLTDCPIVWRRPLI